MPSKRSDNNRLLIPEECRRVKADYAKQVGDILLAPLLLPHQRERFGVRVLVHCGEAVGAQ
jgi:hypothetical protein